MATRKKKTTEYLEGLDIPIATDAKSVMRKKKTVDPSGVVKGSHLTVTTFSDGRTVLEWDDEALLQEVREALASVETKPKKKAEEKTKILNSVEESYKAIDNAKKSSKKSVAKKAPAKKTTKGKTK